MNKIDAEDNLKVAEEILKKINIPGKKDSMLSAAKVNHIEDVAILLNKILSKTCLTEPEIKSVVTEFKEGYGSTFLKFIQKEG